MRNKKSDERKDKLTFITSIILLITAIIDLIKEII